MHTTHKKERDSLLTLKFQAFNKCEIVRMRGIAGANDSIDALSFNIRHNNELIGSRHPERQETHFTC